MNVPGNYRAVSFLGGEAIDLTTLPMASPTTGTVRVRVHQCGVCASNIEPWQGRPWFQYPLPAGSPGHEASGVIDAVSNEEEFWSVGDRVAYIGERGFAEYEIVPTSGLLRLGPEVGNDFLAEPMACAMNIFQRAHIEPGHTVAVIGLGFLGNLLVRLALHRGANVLAISRRAPARSPGGILIIADQRADIVAQVNELTSGQLCDVVIEATGQQEPLALAAELTRIRGRLVIAGYHQDSRQVNMQLWNWRGLDVINAHERDPEVYLDGMRRALDAVCGGVLSMEGLVSHRFALADMEDAVRCTAERPAGFTKAVIEL